MHRLKPSKAEAEPMGWQAEPDGVGAWRIASLLHGAHLPCSCLVSTSRGGTMQAEEGGAQQTRTSWGGGTSTLRQRYDHGARPSS